MRPSNQGEFHRKANGLQTLCKHATLRGLWSKVAKAVQNAPIFGAFFYFDCPMIDLLPSDRSEVYECFSDFFEEINTHRAQ